MEKMVPSKVACEMLGICTMTLRRYVNRGVIRVTHLPFGDIRIPVSEIDRLQGNSGELPKLVEPLIEDCEHKNKSSIEDNLRYALGKYVVKNKPDSIINICKLIEKNTVYNLSVITNEFNKLHSEGMIYNNGGKRASRLVFANKVEN